MIRATPGGRPENVLQGAKHVLFVEGEGDESFDVKVLNELLDTPITIRPLGPSYSVKSVAQALHPHHPDYYFLIDRDPHHDDAFVEQCWNGFPDPDTHNLLIWRRREIENYFLDPAYLIHSRFCKVSQTDIERKVVEIASSRLYLDAVNWVIIDVRERQKRNWIGLFKASDNLSTSEIALEKLVGRPEFHLRISDVEKSVSADELARLFAETLQRMTGGEDGLSLGRGAWLELIQGKEVFAQLVNSACFDVRTRDGETLQGRDKSYEIIKDLLRQEKKIQPVDFQRLNTLIQQRVLSA